MSTTTKLACLCILGAILNSQYSVAEPVRYNINGNLNDNLNTAHRLLRIADVQRQFESQTAQQSRAIVRTYSSIVSMAVSVTLPNELLARINNCYAQVYAWENFEAGLAQILADNLSAEELQLLIDFYDSNGLPPFEIQRFREIIAKSGHIEAASYSFMWENSASCVEQDVELILDYLSTQTDLSKIVTALD